jgi:hypothetical protein
MVMGNGKDVELTPVTEGSFGESRYAGDAVPLDTLQNAVML